MRHLTRHAALAVALAVAIAGPASASIIRSAQPFVGVTHWQFIQSKGDAAAPVYAREVVVNILEIDTTAAGIDFRMQPGNGTDPGEVTRTTTRSFVNSASAKMGVNIGFYDTASTYGGFFTDLNQIAASQGNVYSTAAGGEPTLNINASNVPEIRNAGAAGSSTFNNGGALYNAAGGNQRILNGGNISAPNDSYTNTLNPHTAIGLSQDNKKIFLATVDGRQTDYSEGMFTTELAQVLKDFGAWNAINYDGGGSTTMVMDDSNDAFQNARVINSPSDNSSGQAAGTERVVANSLAVFATPLAGYVPLPAITRPVITGIKPIITTPTIFDTFEGSKGHFASSMTASGSSRNVAATSTATLDTTQHQSGNSSLRLDIVNTNATPTAMQLRFLSGGGTPNNNTAAGDKAMGNTGFVGVFLKMDPGNVPLFVTMLLDDGTADSNGAERGNFLQIVADGQWHLYQWDLSEDGPWANFNSGNGVIGGPNAFIDSLYFSSAAATSGGPNFSGTVWMDTIAYNPDGTLNYLVPEPGTAAMAMAGLMTLVRRRRA
jgi:hypothetical protein